MQRVTDSLRCIIHKNSYFITNYIDNLIGCDKPGVVVEAFAFLLNLIKKLGLVIREEKLFAPQNCIPCLGIDVNIETEIISITGAKLAEIVTVCKDWSRKTKAYKRELQSLISSCLYIQKCMC